MPVGVDETDLYASYNPPGAPPQWFEAAPTPEAHWELDLIRPCPPRAPRCQLVEVLTNELAKEPRR